MSVFDAAFEPVLGRFADVFGEAVSYQPPTGAPVLGLSLDISEEEDGYDPGMGMARVKTEVLLGRIQVAELAEPVDGGEFHAETGDRYKVMGAPRLDNGEWVMSLARIGGG